MSGEQSVGEPGAMSPNDEGFRLLTGSTVAVQGETEGGRALERKKQRARSAEHENPLEGGWALEAQQTPAGPEGALRNAWVGGQQPTARGRGQGVMETQFTSLREARW